MMDVTLRRVEDITPAVKTLWFRPERPVRFIAGQFTELFLPHEDADERGVRRWFTISSSPTEELIGITTKFVAGDGSSYKRHLQALRPGARLKMADPMGDFVLPKNPSIPILFVAGGMGITPVRSMVKWLLDTGEQRDITLLYSVSTPDRRAFHDLLTQYPMRYVPEVSKNDGRITVEKILALLNIPDAQIFLSGPEKLVETLYKELQTKGVMPERIVADYFPGYPES